MNIRNVTILGANGNMGSNIAGIFASFGQAHVNVMSRSLDKSLAAVENAVNSVKCDSIRQRIKAVDYSDLETCIRNSDLIFESLSEDLEIKKTIIRDVAKYMQGETICCTGTSGLSVTELAQVFPPESRGRFLGMHFFNPPYNLNLCEIIATPYMNKELLESIKSYCEQVLLRKVVQVTDTPGFLGNRIGFHSINSALQIAESHKEKGGIDYVDYILGGVTGRSMPPILTADFVGLDIHKSIVDYIYQKTNDYSREAFSLPHYVEQLICQGKFGRKSNEGLYRTINNGEERRMEVYDIMLGEYRPIRQYNISFIEEMKHFIKRSDYSKAYNVLLNTKETGSKICLDFLINYVLYSIVTNMKVGKDKHAADDAMVCGFNWCPPFGIIEALGGVEQFIDLAKKSFPSEKIDNVSLWDIPAEIEKSKYNYRRFIKA